MRTWWLAIIVFAGAVGALALRPICVQLSESDLVGFSTPIDTRTDRDLYLKVFQLRDGRWHQCKTWISRQFFF